MLNKKMEQAINEQIKWEMYSGYLYLSMSAWCADEGLPGFAHWMRLQGQEELAHAMKFYDYVLERGGKIELQAIDKPDHQWKSALAVVEHTLEHEQHVTARINDLMSLAQEEKDHAACIFLQWFIEEQVEEEDSVGEVLHKLKLVSKDGAGMYMLDKEMATRIFTPPAAE
ncbi:ferritin [Desulfovibrio ferrophilus]|uniref:Ferritin n=1 Tax=Desulfovibrio ferrophilus TaxID=241368 RepID=A0A2Z6AXD6_9BACT|nr:ferritin [Desulfovibrio ferrophilus]BBD07880.1 ferroxidase [Desulfovibrio ferrophilus]